MNLHWCEFQDYRLLCMILLSLGPKISFGQSMLSLLLQQKASRTPLNVVCYKAIKASTIDDILVDII